MLDVQLTQPKAIRHGAKMPSDSIRVDYDRCSYCGSCVAVCPPDCITLHNATILIAHEQCTLCRRCLPACPTGALSLASQPTR